jgi:hypothetical protein
MKFQRTGYMCNMGYTKPTVVDYGDLVELTEATSTFGPEDGGAKQTDPNHHSQPTSP